MANEQAQAPLSIVTGAPLSEEAGLGSLTLAGFMTDVCQRFSDNEAMCWKNLSGVTKRWTYSEMYQECRQVAGALLAAGAGKDTRVGVLITNRPEWIISVFGAAMAGCTVVAMNTFSTQHELQYQLHLADVEVLIMEESVASKSFVGYMHELCPALEASVPGELQFAALPYLRRVVCVDFDNTQQGIQAWPEFLQLAPATPDDIIDGAIDALSPMDRGFIFFSSGSTALPKGIQQTHRGATLQCWRFGDYFETSETTRCWSANGFFWSGNFCMALGSTLSRGGCLVLQRFFDPDEALVIFQEEKVTMPIAWPHQEARLVECPGWESADLSAMTCIDMHSAYAKHPSATSKQWDQPNGYGMTETFTFVSGGAGSKIKPGSHGPILPGNTVRIVDPETGEVLPLGQAGEIILKGPTLTPGYLKSPPEDMLDAEGFIHTKDAGYFDEEGNLYWKGRLGDIIKTGGANVSPAEIDAAIVEHESVQTSFTVGIEHDTLGEIVVSCIVLRDGFSADEDGIRAFAKQTLASYKVPRRVLFFSEEELPMTGSNKIQRPELKKLVKERM